MNLKGYTITDRWLGHDMMELVLGKVMCPTNPAYAGAHRQII